jgi:hypothetical protein
MAKRSKSLTPVPKTKEREVQGEFLDVNSFFEHHDKDEELLELPGFLERSQSTGMVRFAPHGDCRNWIEVPETSVRKIQILRQRATCVTPEHGYHSHPYVKLSMDASGVQMAEVLLRLVKQLSQRPQVALAPKGRSRPEETRFFSNASGLRAVKDNCGADYRCVYVGDQCEYGCACVSDDGMGFCSTCCIA